MPAERRWSIPSHWPWHSCLHCLCPCSERDGLARRKRARCRSRRHARPAPNCAELARYAPGAARSPGCPPQVPPSPAPLAEPSPAPPAALACSSRHACRRCAICCSRRPPGCARRRQQPPPTPPLRCSAACRRRGCACRPMPRPPQRPVWSGAASRCCRCCTKAWRHPRPRPRPPRLPRLAPKQHLRGGRQRPAVLQRRQREQQQQPMMPSGGPSWKRWSKA